MEASNIKWTCTDPDNKQYGRQISEKVFEFKENNRLHQYNEEGQVIQITINLNHYSDEEIESTLNAYGYTLKDKKGELNIYQEYGDDANWIIAECIFEQESGLY